MHKWLVPLILLLGAPIVHAQSGTIDIPTVNGSVVITTGSTFQTVLAATAVNSAARRSLTIQNNNATDSCWVFIGAGTATKGTSLLLAAAGGSYTRYYPYIPSDTIQATCNTTGDTLYVDTQ